MATTAGAGGDVHRVLYDAVALCSASCSQRTTTNPTMKGAATPVTVGLDQARQCFGGLTPGFTRSTNARLQVGPWRGEAASGGDRRSRHNIPGNPWLPTTGQDLFQNRLETQDLSPPE